MMKERIVEAWHNAFYRWSMVYLMTVNTAILLTLWLLPGTRL